MALPSSQAVTAASRPGGKFASIRPRGKFANLAAAAPSKPESADDAARASSETAARKRRIRTERQAKIFADIDEAENLALELLSLASSTASSLSELTVGDGEFASKMEELVKNNGDAYLEKVKNVHALLTPHADLVVAYRNHAVDTGESTEIKTEKKVGDAPNQRSGEGKSANVAGEGEKTLVDGDKKEHFNMYAARVEMRLAMERRDIMKELLRLENEEAENADGADGSNSASDDAISGKRKREAST